jgi:glucokinase
MSKRVGVGLDLGGTSIKYALATESGEILKHGYLPSDADADKTEIINNLYISAKEMIDYAGSIGQTVQAIGVGTPGNVNLETGWLMGSTPNFKSWSNINIKSELGSKVNLPVYADNDANLMALGEARFGAGKGYRNIICVTVGTGIGGGFIINGELYRGSAYAGAEFGHSLVEVDGIECRCGSNGCLEMYASATAMLRDFSQFAREINFTPTGNEINMAYLFELRDQGNEAAKKAIERGIYFLGRALAGSINIFNPEAIIIGGGVADAGEIFIDAIRQVAFKYAMEKPKENVRIVGAKLGNKAGFLGALSFALEQRDLEYQDN